MYFRYQQSPSLSKRARRLRSLAVVASVGLLTGLTISSANAIPAFWNGPANGNWSAPSNWSSTPFFPSNGNGAPTYEVNTNGLSGDVVITLDTSVSLASMRVSSGDSLRVNSGSRVLEVGAGSFGGLILDNTGNSTIAVDGAGSQLNLTFAASGFTNAINSGIIEAINGGSLVLRGNSPSGFITIDQLGGPDRTLRAIDAGSTLELAGTGLNIRGGFLNIGAGAALRVNASTNGFSHGLDNVQVTNAGTIEVVAGASLDHFVFGPLNNTGLIHLNGTAGNQAVLNAINLDLQGSGRLLLDEGRIQRAPFSSLLNIQNSTGHTIEGQGSIEAASLFNSSLIQATGGDVLNVAVGVNSFGGPILDNSGTLRADGAGSQLNLTSQQPFFSGKRNTGTIEAINGGMVMLDNSMAGLSSIENTGVIRATNGGHLIIRNTAVLNFFGSVQVDGTSTIEYRDGGFVEPAGGGPVITGGGTLINSSSFISGTGQFDVNVINRSVLSPGNPNFIISVGQLDFNGTLTAQATSFMVFDLAGKLSNQFDRVNVSSSFQPGGALLLNLNPALSLNLLPTDTFTILNAGSMLPGVFANVASGTRLSTFGQEGSFVVHYGVSSPFGVNQIVLADFSTSIPGMTPINPILPARPPTQPNDPFEFVFINPAPRTVRWFDPEVAVGYEYRVTSGPNFAQLFLPAGFLDGQYMLEILDPTHANFGAILPVIGDGSLLSFDFGILGVNAFRITGIEIGAGIDPLDFNGFPTGLSFVSGGVVLSPRRQSLWTQLCPNRAAPA